VSCSLDDEDSLDDDAASDDDIEDDSISVVDVISGVVVSGFSDVVDSSEDELVVWLFSDVVDSASTELSLSETELDSDCATDEIVADASDEDCATVDSSDCPATEVSPDEVDSEESDVPSFDSVEPSDDSVDPVWLSDDGETFSDADETFSDDGDVDSSSPLPSTVGSSFSPTVDPDPSIVESVVASGSVDCHSKPVASLSISSSVNKDVSVVSADESSMPVTNSSSASEVVILTTPSCEAGFVVSLSAPSSSSSHQSSLSSSSSKGWLVVSTGKSSSLMHESMLQSSLPNRMLSSWHLPASAGPSLSRHNTLRLLEPPPQSFEQSVHGPANHCAGHVSGPSHSRSTSGLDSASHLLSSSAFLMTSFSNFPQTIVRLCTPLPQSAEHFDHCDENQRKSQGVELHARESSGFSRFSQNLSSKICPDFDAQYAIRVSVVAPHESH